MNTMQYKGYAARVEFDSADRIFVGHLAGVSDVVGFHGATMDRLEKAFHEAVDDYVAACASQSRAVAVSAHEHEDQAFIDAISGWDRDE